MPEQKRCNSCGEINNADALRCSECGHMLSSSTVLLPNNSKVITDSSQKVNIVPPPAPVNPPSRFTVVNKKTTWWIVGGCVILIVLVFTLLILPRLANPGPQPITTLPPLPNGLGVVIAPNGENVGVNDGAFPPFDIGRADSDLKRQAVQALRDGNAQEAIALWSQGLEKDTNDAEALIYIENQKAVAFNHVTLIVGLDFQQPFPDTAAQSTLQGAYIAQKEFNDSHNIKLRLLIANTGGELDYIRPVAQQIGHIASQDPSVVGILGWQTSARTENVLDSLRKTGTHIPIVSQKATASKLTGVSPYFFRIVPSNEVQAPVAAKMANMLQATQVVVFVDPNNLYSQDLAQDFKQQFTATNHRILPDENFTSGKTTAASFSKSLRTALKNTPDPSHVVILFAGITTYDAEQFQDALGAFPKLLVISGDGGYAARPNSYGRWYFVSVAYHDEWSALTGNRPPPFFQEYDDAFDPTHQSPGDYGRGLPNDTAIVSYDAAKVLSRGIEDALKGTTKLTPQALTDALTQITVDHPFQGISGQIAFDANHDPIDKAFVILRVDDKGYIKMFCVGGHFSNSSDGSLPKC
ncbi:MAG: ABC transporter substrate-binding protein [Ktedonobacteraceae bacterium]|nr:ABC transporter substrate-binding protein [Ktedonobacteraceae bacterium]